MPIYEFGCKRCGHRFEELFLGTADVAAARCPECRSKRIERVASAFFARTRSSGGDGRSGAVGGSACGTCAATSCATCKR